MGEIMLEFIHEEYSDKYHGEYSDFLELLKEFFIEFIGTVLGHQYLKGPDHPASAAPKPPASLSACLLCTTMLPILPDTLVLSHTQLWLPARLAQHQLKSQLPHSDLSADSASCSCRRRLTNSSSVQWLQSGDTSKSETCLKFLVSHVTWLQFSILSQ